MKNALQLYTLAGACIVTIAIFASYSGEKKGPGFATGPAPADPSGQVVRAVNLDRPFDLAGEPVPMDNPDARERLDRELLVNTYWQSSTLLNLKSAARFFPLVDRILTRNNIPVDFKYVAVAESSLRNETSPAGAKGFWQFMKETGRYYGLEINEEIDERYHLEKATEAACLYLRDYYKRFGSWTLAAAAYNMGGTRLAREVETQRARTYYDLNLGAETSRYVFRIIALKTIMEHPREFGFFLDEGDRYDPMDEYTEVEIRSGVGNWGDFAREHGISYRALKVYNPWLIADRLTNREGKAYLIRIPEKKF